MEELTENAEEGEDEGSKQSEQKLGKLQYKVRIYSITTWMTLANNWIFEFSSWNMTLIPTA